MSLSLSKQILAATDIVNQATAARDVIRGDLQDALRAIFNLHKSSFEQLFPEFNVRFKAEWLPGLYHQYAAVRPDAVYFSLEVVGRGFDGWRAVAMRAMPNFCNITMSLVNDINLQTGLVFNEDSMGFCCDATLVHWSMRFE